MPTGMNMKACAHCGAVNEPAKFCGECGKPQGSHVAPTAPATSEGASCKQPVRADGLKCQHRGSSLASTGMAERDVASGESEEGRTCARCKRFVRISETACPTCGFSVHQRHSRFAGLWVIVGFVLAFFGLLYHASSREEPSLPPFPASTYAYNTRILPRSDARQPMGDYDPNARTANDLRTYLQDNFGHPGYETSWYNSITAVFIENDVAVAQVIPSHDAPGVCMALSGFVYTTRRSHGLRSVRIVGANGEVLIDRRTVAQRCA